MIKRTSELAASLGFFSAKVRDEREIFGPSAALDVARRFKKLFLDHGVAEAQIPRVFPSISLAKLQSEQTLIEVLTPEVIDAASRLFGVRMDWIEGFQPMLYEPLDCYKTPQLFVELLQNLSALDDNAFRIVTANDDLLTSRVHEPVIPLLLEKITTLPEEQPVFRFHFLGRGWHWNHTPCRLQLKAMARIFWEAFHRNVPIHRVPAKELEAMDSGLLVPACRVGDHVGTKECLEDYAMSKAESQIAKEADELDLVLAYIKNHFPEGVPHLAR